MIRFKLLLFLAVILVFANGCEYGSTQNHNQLLIIDYANNKQQIVHLDKEFDDAFSASTDTVKNLFKPFENLITKRFYYLNSAIDTLLLLTNNPQLDLNSPLSDQIDNFNLLDNYEIPTKFFIGDEPAMDLDTKYSGSNIHKMLKRDIEKITTDLATLSISIIRTQIDVNEYMDGNPFFLPWQIHQFYGLPVAMVLGNLSRLQVQLIETKIQILELIKNNNCYQHSV